MTRFETTNYPLISIIVPVKRFNEMLDVCLESCLKLDYPNLEILVLPDATNPANSLNPTRKSSKKKLRIIPTGSMGPAEKRNRGMEEAGGEILAFLDDDTYPAEDWLKNSLEHFKNEDIAAVGGPAVTPESDDLRQKASGAVFSSLLGGGTCRYRYTPAQERLVDDFPSCNFIVRKSIMEELGGFQTKFWPGEDTAVCLDITKRLGRKIIYDPNVLIYHHRRRLFLPHLKQVTNYALHRGYFAKRFPQTSLRFSYFLPSVLTIGLLFGWTLGFIHPLFFSLWAICLVIYLALALLTGLKHRSPKKVFLVFLGIVLTHLSYGIWFIKGLFSRKLQEER
ncbi:MAG: glycosyltransferase [Nitrospirae bacterium]|nr:glycosyltransferase [Nitrospirota bacterium]